jgi:hypothetical protein
MSVRKTLRNALFLKIKSYMLLLYCNQQIQQLKSNERGNDSQGDSKQEPHKIGDVTMEAYVSVLISYSH